MKRVADGVAEMSEQKQAMTDNLKNEVLKLLRSYRLTMTQDDEGNGYPLVDAVTPPGDAAITRGIEELEYLAEDISRTIEPLEARQEVQVRLGVQQDQIAGLEARIEAMVEVGLNREAKIRQLEAENKRLRGHIEQLREAVEEGLSTYKVPMTARICEAIAALAATEPPIGDSGMVAHEVLNGGWVSFDMAQPEGPNLVQQYLGDSVLDQQNPPFWAFPTSRWRGAKELYATHWRYVQGPHE